MKDERSTRLPPVARRIEAGASRGRLDALTPCLLLAQAGGSFCRHRRAGDRAGLFDFLEDRREDTGGVVYSGLLMPLALCRDRELRAALEGLVGWASSPASGWSGVDRRRALRERLEREHLDGPLKPADPTPTVGWMRFVPNAATYSELLVRFDYVTSVADEPGRSSVILDHAPFIWTSCGAFLDWRLDGDYSVGISPFHLYLAASVGDLTQILRRHPDWSRSFPPVAYWTPFTRPDEAVRSARVSARLTQGEADYGWIDLDLDLGDQSARITLSEVYDPLSDLLDWLWDVANEGAPIGVEVDEEGSEAQLIAHPFGADRLLVTVLDRWERLERASAVVDRAAFLKAFRDEFTRFLKSELNLERWNSGEEEDHYVARLLAHPFIGEGEGDPDDASGWEIRAPG